MDYSTVLKAARTEIYQMKGQTLDTVTIGRPTDLEYAKLLSKVVSKISPILGNMIEYSIVKFLNDSNHWKDIGKWKRQDPGFPDATFLSKLEPRPGIEIKTWFPLATEITARFKESITHFEQDNIDVALIAWIPEYILFGKPMILDVWMDSAKSLAVARDKHYHNPPDYLVIEPLDTSKRTANLQQTNTLGFKFQGTPKQFKQAELLVDSWGRGGKSFDFSLKYQDKLKLLMAKFPYRLDTNFAKIDRIKHAELESFKTKIMNMKVKDHTIREWSKLIATDETTMNGIIEAKDLIEELI